MKPLETEATDTTFGGVASKGIGDLPTETHLETLPDKSVVRVHRSVWLLEPIERSAVMLGARLVMDVYGDAIPPIRLAIEEPTMTDPETVYGLVDEAIALSIGTSLVSVLRDIGVERDPAMIAVLPEKQKEELSSFLRSIEDPPLLEAPAFLELSEDEQKTIDLAAAALAEARAKREEMSNG